MKLADEWKDAWKWLNTWLGVAAALAPILYDQVDVLKGVVSDSTMHHVTAVLVALMVVNSVRKKTA